MSKTSADQLAFEQGLRGGETAAPRTPRIDVPAAEPAGQAAEIILAARYHY